MNVPLRAGGLQPSKQGHFERMQRKAQASGRCHVGPSWQQRQDEDEGDEEEADRGGEADAEADADDADDAGEDADDAAGAPGIGQ